MIYFHKILFLFNCKDTKFLQITSCRKARRLLHKSPPAFLNCRRAFKFARYAFFKSTPPFWGIEKPLYSATQRTDLSPARAPEVIAPTVPFTWWRLHCRSCGVVTSKFALPVLRE